MNRLAKSSFKLSSYQLHQQNSNTPLNIPAVSHKYHRKISKVDTSISSGSSDLVHINKSSVHVSSCLPTHPLFVWVDSVSCEGKRLTTNPVQPSAPVWNWGGAEVVWHICEHSDCFSLYLEVTGRSRGDVCSSEHPSLPGDLSSSHLSRTHLRFWPCPKTSSEAVKVYF